MATSATSLRGIDVLVADPESLPQSSITGYLQCLGCCATTTNDGLSALKIFLDDPYAFDLVLTDYAMPQLNGLQLARRIIMFRPNLPLVLVAGSAPRHLGGAARGVSFDSVLHKPFTVAQLEQSIRHALHNGAGRAVR